MVDPNLMLYVLRPKFPCFVSFEDSFLGCFSSMIFVGSSLEFCRCKSFVGSSLEFCLCKSFVGSSLEYFLCKILVGSSSDCFIRFRLSILLFGEWAKISNDSDFCRCLELMILEETEFSVSCRDEIDFEIRGGWAQTAELSSPPRPERPEIDFEIREGRALLAEFDLSLRPERRFFVSFALRENR